MLLGWSHPAQLEQDHRLLTGINIGARPAQLDIGQHAHVLPAQLDQNHCLVGFVLPAHLVQDHRLLGVVVLHAQLDQAHGFLVLGSTHTLSSYRPAPSWSTSASTLTSWLHLNAHTAPGVVLLLVGITAHGQRLRLQPAQLVQDHV